MGLRVWVLYAQTHAHKPIGFDFLPIDKPLGREIDLYSCPNGVKTRRVSGLGYRCHLYSCLARNRSVRFFNACRKEKK